MGSHRRRTLALAVAGLGLLAACTQDAPPPAAPPERTASPGAPLRDGTAPAFPAPAPDGSPAGAPVRPETDAETAAREALHRVTPAPPFGQPVPAKALRWKLTAAGVEEGGRTMDVRAKEGRAELERRAKGARILLVVEDPELFVAQVAPVLALFDDAGAEVHWLHPDAPSLSVPTALKDEKRFGEWLDEPTPGRLRIIQRADGFELQTAVGKLPGADPNGPSVPVRGGQLDYGGLRAALERLAGRFDDTEDLCFVPSYGTELVKVIRAIGASFVGPDRALFDAPCLVYPRPPSRPANP